MKMTISHCILVTALVLTNARLAGQTTNMDSYFDYLPRETVIFEDDFSKPTVGVPPKGWTVERRQNVSFSEIDTKSGSSKVYAMGDAGLLLKPDLVNHERLPDSFTFEFDICMLTDAEKKPQYRFHRCVSLPSWLWHVR